MRAKDLWSIVWGLLALAIVIQLVIAMLAPYKTLLAIAFILIIGFAIVRRVAKAMRASGRL